MATPGVGQTVSAQDFQNQYGHEAAAKFPVGKTLSADAFKQAYSSGATPPPTTTAQEPNYSVGGFLGNVVKSGANLVGNVAQTVLHPIKTVETIGKIGLGGVEKFVPGQQGAETQFNQLTDFFKNRYGSVDAIKNTAYSDPVGMAADLASFLEGGGAVINAASKFGDVGKIAELGDVAKVGEASKVGAAANVAEAAKAPSTLAKIGQTAQNIGETINPIRQGAKLVAPITNKVSELAQNLAKFGTTQLTGLSPDTISTIVKNAPEFSPENMAKYTRENIGQEVFGQIKQRLEDLSSNGKQYQAIREATGSVSLPKNIVSDVLGKYGITMEDGKLLTSAESVPLKPGDVSALESFIKQYGGETKMSNNAFLNTRKALDNLAEYDAAKSDISNKISRDLRSAYDAVGKEQIPGLKTLDNKYAPEVKQLNQIRKDYLKPDGTVKDNFYSKVASVGNKGKESVLARLEKISPGIGQKTQVLKAVEDITAAGGQKVGTYARAGLGIGGVVAGFRPEMIVAAILAEPKIATQVLRGYAKLVGADSSVAQRIIKNIKFTGAPATIKKALAPGVLTPATVLTNPSRQNP